MLLLLAPGEGSAALQPAPGKALREHAALSLSLALPLSPLSQQLDGRAKCSRRAPGFGLN